MTDEPQGEGGPSWERNQAAKQIADALLAGDAAAVEVGADRLGDAITNAAAAVLIPTLKHTLEVVLKQQVSALAQQEERRFDYLLDQMTAFTRKEDGRHEAYHAEITNGFAEVRGLRGDFTALQSGFQSIRDQLAELATDFETLKSDNLRLHEGQARLDEGQAQLRKDHIDFRSNQETFRVAQDLLVGKVSDLGENFDTLQQIFDLMKDEGERRWAHATRALAEQTQEMNEQRTIIERKERQIQELINQVQALRSELSHVREQTIADEIGADERRHLTEATRWMAEHRDQIVLKDAPDTANDHR